jgi:YfiH family protein
VKNFLIPDWPAPANVHALTTTRLGGVSPTPFDSFNLADHVGNSPECVTANRMLLVEQLNLPAEPYWLTQVHGNAVVHARSDTVLPEADASFARETGVVCAALTADCLPVLFSDVAGQSVAAAHAGWRGLAAGVLEATLTSIADSATEVMAWLGPAIGPTAFEVGDDVRLAFLEQDAKAASCFKPLAGGKWLADIYALARMRLKAAGLQQIYGGGYCTFEDKERFYSYRRDGVTGRMASLIWLSKKH